MSSRNPDPFWEARFHRGEKDVMETVYRDNFDAVRRAAARILSEPADRDTIVQQVFVDLCSSRRMRESWSGTSLTAWLCTIARNQAIDFARREKRLTDLSALENTAAAAPDPLQEFRQELARFAERLDSSRRQLLELRFVRGLTQVEAAGQLGMPRSTLEDWERELRNQLAAHLLGKPVSKGAA